MNQQDIKSHIWITYQGADNSVWARIKNPYVAPKFTGGSKYKRFEQLAGANTFPILNTTEIGLEIQGEDLKPVFQYKMKSETDWTTDFGYQLTGKDYDYFEYDLKMMSNDFETRLSLRYTPKQTPKETMEVKYRISFRHNDGKRHTLFADNQSDLIYKLSHLDGEVLLIDTEKQTPKADKPNKWDIINEKFDNSIDKYLDKNSKADSEKTYSQEELKELSKKFEHLPTDVLEDLCSEDTPLSKVDNHIGETAPSINEILSIEDIASVKVGDRYLKNEYPATCENAYTDGFVEGATYCTQHPDPEMVEELNKYKTLYEELDAIVEPLQDRLILLEAEKGAMVDRILEYVSKNAQMLLHDGTTKENKPLRYFQSGADNLKVDREHIKSMRDDILKDLSK